jgi:hypothetical protein
MVPTYDQTFEEIQTQKSRSKDSTSYSKSGWWIPQKNNKMGLRKLHYYIPTQIWDSEDDFLKAEKNKLKDC